MELQPSCEICGGLGWVKHNVPPAHKDFGKMFPCECRRDELKERRMRRLEAISGLMETELSLTIDEIRDRPDTRLMIDAAHDIITDPYGFLTVWGGVGNGKTLLLQAIINHLRTDLSVEGAYIVFADLLDFVRAGFDDDSFDERDRYKFLKRVPALAIDEIDKARMTAYSDEFRSKFFDYRYRLAVEGKAVTIFAMNCDPGELPMHVYDRLRDGRFIIVHNGDTSIRPTMKRGS